MPGAGGPGRRSHSGLCKSGLATTGAGWALCGRRWCRRLVARTRQQRTCWQLRGAPLRRRSAICLLRKLGTPFAPKCQRMRPGSSGGSWAASLFRCYSSAWGTSASRCWWKPPGSRHLIGYFVLLCVLCVLLRVCAVILSLHSILACCSIAQVLPQAPGLARRAGH